MLSNIYRNYLYGYNLDLKGYYEEEFSVGNGAILGSKGWKVTTIKKRGILLSLFGTIWFIISIFNYMSSPYNQISKQTPEAMGITVGYFILPTLLILFGIYFLIRKTND